MAILIVFMGIGPSSHWKRTQAGYLKAQLMSAALASVVFGAVFPLFYGESYNVWAALAVCFASWLMLSVLVDLKEKLRNASTLLSGLSRLTRSYYGMVIGHVGLAVCVVGVSLTSQYSEEIDLRMAVGEKIDIVGYQFEFKGIGDIQGPNYVGQQGWIQVTEAGVVVADLKPEKRRYNAQQGQVMTEAAIDAGLMRDLYVALGEPLGKDAWAVRVHYKPFVRWIWLGGILMTIGGMLAAMDKRYRVKSRSTAAVDTAAVAGAS
jgi:cytochrome c-type biogenesis protein CcmF